MNIIRPRLARLLRVTSGDPRHEKRRDPSAKRRGHFDPETKRFTAELTLKCTPDLKDRLKAFADKYHVSQAVVLRDAVDFYLSAAEMEFEVAGPITSADLTPALPRPRSKYQ